LRRYLLRARHNTPQFDFIQRLGLFFDYQFVPLDDAGLARQIAIWQRAWPDCWIWACVPEAERHGIPLLQAHCRSRSMPLVGAVFPALLDASGFRQHGLLLLCMRPGPACFLLEDLQRDGGARLGSAIQTAMQGTAKPAQAESAGSLFLVFDAMLPNIATLLSESHAALPRPPRYLGVNAGSETFLPMPCLFDAEKVVSDGAIGIFFPQSLHSAVHHAYAESSSALRATSAAGNRIISIDNRPAFAVYQALVCEAFGVHLTAENFYDYAVHFPFGLVTAVDILVRIPVAIGPDQSLVCVGEVPPNSMLRLLHAPQLADSACVHDLEASLQPDVGASALLTFYCAGRRMHFAEDATLELQRLRQVPGCTDLFGALSLGEIDTLEGIDYPRFHNAAVVCVATHDPADSASL
jgi:hypothetical protein